MKSVAMNLDNSPVTCRVRCCKKKKKKMATEVCRVRCWRMVRRRYSFSRDRWKSDGGSTAFDAYGRLGFTGAVGVGVGVGVGGAMLLP